MPKSKGRKKTKSKKNIQKREVWQKPGFDPKAGIQFTQGQLRRGPEIGKKLFNRKILP